MSCRILTGSFDREEDLVQAIARVREHGWRIVDVYVPDAVHDLGRLLGPRPSRLPWVAFVCGALGAALALGFQFWASAIDWPIVEPPAVFAPRPDLLHPLDGLRMRHRARLSTTR